MHTELPGERLRRRFSSEEPLTRKWIDAAPERGQGPVDDADGDDDQGASLSRWLPAEAPQSRRRWLAAVRADPGRAGVIGLVVVGFIAVLITIVSVMGDKPPPVVSAKLPPVQMASSAAATPSPAPEGPVVVSVVGLVHKPGLVSLSPGARVADALAAAGGSLDGADLIGLNMAQRVGDGEQIVVGIAPPPGEPAAFGSGVGPGPDAPRTSSTGTPTGSASPAAVVDLNNATVEELDTLPGVGPVTAAAIVAWRQANGRFSSVDQLGEVEGIGPTRLEKLRPRVRV